MSESSSLYLRVVDNHGKLVTTCSGDDFIHIMKPMLQRYQNIRLELATPPNNAMVLHPIPFQDPASLCSATEVQGREPPLWDIVLDVPVRLQSGSDQHIVVEFSASLDITSIKASLRRELRKSIPMNTTALDAFSDWFDGTSGDVFGDILDSAESGDC